MKLVKLTRPSTYTFRVAGPNGVLSMTLGPGMNEVPDDLWRVARTAIPGIRDRLRQGILLEVTASPAPGVKVNGFGDLNPQVQLNLAHDAYDLSLLRKWIGLAKDPVVMSFLRKRIAEVEERRKAKKNDDAIVTASETVAAPETTTPSIKPPEQQDESNTIDDGDDDSNEGDHPQTSALMFGALKQEEALALVEQTDDREKLAIWYGQTSNKNVKGAINKKLKPSA